MKILITGGANGIGRDIAIHYTNIGYKVIVIDNDYHALRDLETNYSFITCYHGDLCDKRWKGNNKQTEKRETKPRHSLTQKI